MAVCFLCQGFLTGGMFADSHEILRVCVSDTVQPLAFVEGITGVGYTHLRNILTVLKVMPLGVLSFGVLGFSRLKGLRSAFRVWSIRTFWGLGP